MGLPAKKTSPEGEKRLEEVSLSLDGKRLVFIFENGEGYALTRKDIPGDDGSPITGIEIFDHREAVLVRQASGEAYDLPWDSIKHFARGGRRTKLRMGGRLKKLRKERGLSQEGLARKARISRMQLIRLEKNLSNPSLETLLSLSRALEVSPREWVD